MKVKVNFDEAVNHMVPPDEYEVIVEECEVREGKTTGIGYLNWTFRISSGPYAGRCVFATTSLQNNALWKLQELCQALGLPCKGKVSIDPEEAKGKALLVTVSHEEFGGVTREGASKFRAA